MATLHLREGISPLITIEVSLKGALYSSLETIIGGRLKDVLCNSLPTTIESRLKDALYSSLPTHRLMATDKSGNSPL